MRILVVGGGKVGNTIAQELAKEKHDVVVIDRDEEVLRRIEDVLDVLCIQGSGANISTLMEAGADRSDIIMAATASDEVNMLCCLMAKRLGTKYAIARIRDPEYADSLELLQSAMDIDLSVNPERATAQEISRMLRFPFVSGVETFAKGRVEMVAFPVQEGDPMVGIPLSEVDTRIKNLPRVLYAAVEREGDVIIPRGDFVIQVGDRVHVASDPYTVSSFFTVLGRSTEKIRSAVIIGGGRISYYLAKMIIPLGVRVTIVEMDEDKAALLSESLPEANIVCGDGTDKELLDEIGLTDTDAFITLTDRDEENLMAGLYATRQGVEKVIVKNSRTAYSDIIGSMGLHSVVSPKDITCANLLRYVRGRLNVSGAKVERLYRLMDGKAETMEFIARPGDSYIGVPLMDLHVMPGALVAVIVRKGKVIVPFGRDYIEAGDRVVVITRGSGISDLNEVIRK